MADPAEHHLKLLIGDLLVTVARLSAENEALREQLAVLVPQPPPEEPPHA